MPWAVKHSPSDRAQPARDARAGARAPAVRQRRLALARAVAAVCKDAKLVVSGLAARLPVRSAQAALCRRTSCRLLLLGGRAVFTPWMEV